VVAEMTLVTRSPDMVCKLIVAAHTSSCLIAIQNAKDHDHLTANAATNVDALAHHLEEAAMAHHNVRNAITNDLDRLATLANAKPPTHPNLVDSEPVAHIGTVLAQVVLYRSRKNLPTSNLKQ
jgi:hypothetical protein